MFSSQIFFVRSKSTISHGYRRYPTFDAADRIQAEHRRVNHISNIDKGSK
jgi:hypothetical protein